MPVKIEMDMPTRCAICRFRSGYMDSVTLKTIYKCGLGFQKIDIKKRKRPKFCPLKACK